MSPARGASGAPARGRLTVLTASVRSTNRGVRGAKTTTTDVLLPARRGSMLKHRTTEATEEEKTEARERLRLALPHLFLASNMAKLQVPDGKICLGTIAKEASGGGRITASFESAGFLIDLDTLLGPLDPEVDDDRPVELRNLHTEP